MLDTIDYKTRDKVLWDIITDLCEGQPKVIHTSKGYVLVLSDKTYVLQPDRNFGGEEGRLHIDIYEL